MMSVTLAKWSLVSGMEVVIKNLDYIFNNPDIGIAICNVQSGSIEIANPAFKKILGCARDEFLERLPGEIFFPSTKHKSAIKEANLFNTTTNDLSFETTHEREDGSHITIYIHLKITKDHQSKIESRIIYLHNITEKEALHELFTFQQFALENINEPLFFLDQEGKFCYINKAASGYLGFSKSALLTMYIQDIDPDLNPNKWALHLEFQSSKSLLFETTFKKANGQIVPVKITASYLYYDKAIYSMFQFNEILERKTKGVEFYQTDRFD